MSEHGAEKLLLELIVTIAESDVEENDDILNAACGLLVLLARKGKVSAEVLMRNVGLSYGAAEVHIAVVPVRDKEEAS